MTNEIMSCAGKITTGEEQSLKKHLKTFLFFFPSKEIAIVNLPVCLELLLQSLPFNT